MDMIDEMKEWLLECFSDEYDQEQIEELTEDECVEAIEQHYDGGYAGFLSVYNPDRSRRPYINSLDDIYRLIGDQMEHMMLEGYWPAYADLKQYVVDDYWDYIRQHHNFQWGDEEPELTDEEFFGLFDPYVGENEFGTVELDDENTLYLQQLPYISSDGTTFEAYALRDPYNDYGYYQVYWPVHDWIIDAREAGDYDKIPQDDSDMCDWDDFFYAIDGVAYFRDTEGQWYRNELYPL